MNPDAQATDWKPPYVPYATLTGFIEKKCGSNPLPPRIDKGFLDNYSGSVQVLIMTAIKAIGLIEENGTVRPALHKAASGPIDRKEVLRAWAEDFYAEQIELAKNNGTAQMLWESFAKSGFGGSTLRKAVVFYLSLAEDLGLPNSPHFKPPRQSVTGSASKARRSRPEQPTETPVTPPPTPPPAPATEAGHRTTVDLGPAGRVTLVVDINPILLTRRDRDFFYGLVDAMENRARLQDSQPDQVADEVSDSEVSTS